MEIGGEDSVRSAGILTAETGHGRILAFDDATRSRRNLSIRATAMVLADPASRALQASLDRLAPSNVTVLIHGETGSGKELVARYLHAASPRRKGAFVAVNCGALSETLAEAELFGHEKGAFTGATEARAGWFEAARGGTILLDEIGDLPLPLQVKLLRVLQEQEVTRVGSRTPLPIDVRVIAATNLDLRVAVRERRFREDLYFRLNVASVSVPSLRQRRGDIEPLARHFLQVYRTRLDRSAMDFEPAALEALQHYLWPGNIRELENVIHHAIHIAPGKTIRASDLNLDKGLMAAEMSLQSLEERVSRAVEDAVAAGEADVFGRSVSSMVLSVFARSGENQVRTAAILGVSRNTLRTHLSRLGMLEPRRREAGGASARVKRMLKVGYQKYGTSSILKSKGTLERRLAERDIEVTWTEYTAGPQMLDALNRCDIDFATTGEAPPIFAQEAGVPLLYLAHDPPAPRGEGILVRAGSDLVTVADLKGRKIGLNCRSNVHYLLVRALQMQGLTIGDVEPVNLSPDDNPLRLLETGAIDAWAIWDPLLSAAQSMADLRVLADGQGLVPNRQFYLGRRPYVERHRTVIETVLQELRIAGEQAVRHSASMAKMWARELGIDAAVLEPALRRMTHGARPIDRIVIEEQQMVADTLYSSGLLASTVLISDAVLAVEDV